MPHGLTPTTSSARRFVSRTGGFWKAEKEEAWSAAGLYFHPPLRDLQRSDTEGGHPVHDLEQSVFTFYRSRHSSLSACLFLLRYFLVRCSGLGVRHQVSSWISHSGILSTLDGLVCVGGCALL